MQESDRIISRPTWPCGRRVQSSSVLTLPHLNKAGVWCRGTRWEGASTLSIKNEEDKRVALTWGGSEEFSE